MTDGSQPPRLLDALALPSAGLVAPPRHDLEAAYGFCARVARARARNFAYGFLFLPRAKKRAMNAAYAFSRVCDDVVDEERPREDKVLLLAECRRELDRCLERPSENPIFLALADTARRFDIPLAHFHELIDGVEMDLDARRYRDFADLYPFCYKVAGVVGLISLRIFGASDLERARAGAVDLGIAMQLTNILRDVREDLDHGRVYFPQDELARFGVMEEDLHAGRVTPGFRELMAFSVARAREYFARGRALIPLLEPDARFCPAVLQGIYSRLLDRMEGVGYDVFAHRVRLSGPHKLWLVLRYALRPA